MAQRRESGAEGSEAAEGARVALLQAQAGMASLRAKRKHALERWKKVAALMALKEPGTSKARRLRATHLCKAGFSLLLAAKWRQLARHAASRRQGPRSAALSACRAAAAGQLMRAEWVGKCGSPCWYHE